MSTKAAGKKREASPDLDIDLPEEVDPQNVGTEDKAEGSSSKVKESSAGSRKKRKSASVPGIIYISRLPPGMTPQKVKHLMSRWGEVGKIYAQKRDGQSLPLRRLVISGSEGKIGDQR